MKLVSWNYRGQGGSIKVEALKNIINTKKQDILLVQETKVPEEEVMSRSSLFWKYSVGKAISSRGASGGITTLCRADKYNIKSAKENTHWILVEVQNRSNLELIYICNVYGPTHYKEKMDFWESLLSLKTDLHGKEIVIAGDFNTTKSSLEKRGGSIIRDPFGEKLEDLKEDLYLLNPMPKNGKYTCSNK